MIVDSDGEEYVVFDDHVHVGRRVNTPILSPHGGDTYDGDYMIKEMDAAGVDLIVAFPFANPHTDYRTNNEEILAFSEAYPGRVAPFVRIQPLFRATAANDIAEYAGRGAKGIKFHPFMDGGANPVNNREIMFPLMEVAAAHGLAVLIHSGEAWNCSPTLIGDLADNFPNGNFIIGHSGLWEGHQDAIVVAKRTPNIWLDTAEIYPPAILPVLLRGAGPDRLLYGSDAPHIPFGLEIAKLAKYGQLLPHVKRKVLGGNLAELLGLELTQRAPTVVPVSQL